VTNLPQNNIIGNVLCLKKLCVVTNLPQHIILQKILCCGRGAQHNILSKNSVL